MGELKTGVAQPGYHPPPSVHHVTLVGGRPPTSEARAAGEGGCSLAGEAAGRRPPHRRTALIIGGEVGGRWIREQSGSLRELTCLRGGVGQAWEGRSEVR